MQDQLGQTALEVANQQLASSKANDALSADYANYNKTTFRPLEQGIVADAQNYDTPAKRQAAADSAMADVNRGFSAANEAAMRRMAANGINPGSTRAMSVMQGQDVAQASANAGAAYKARQGVETQGHARQMDAASLGRNLPSAQATSAQIAMQQGNAAVDNTGAPLTAANAGTALVGQGYGTAINGQQVSGNLYGTAASLSNQDNGAWGALGGALGQYAGSSAGSSWITGMLPSDKNLKSNVEPMSDKEALAATNETPVSMWEYDPAKMAAAGVPMPPGGEGEQVGPMAQDVNETMGEGAAPGGKQLSLVTMNGINMKAVQAVDKKVANLTKKVSSLAAMIRGGKIEARAVA